MTSRLRIKRIARCLPSARPPKPDFSALTDSELEELTWLGWYCSDAGPDEFETWSPLPHEKSDPSKLNAEQTTRLLELTAKAGVTR
jgi:hypothetical protein